MSTKQSRLTEPERAVVTTKEKIGPLASTAIDGCFEQIKDALAILDTAYVALDKADSGDDGISVSDAITTLKIGLEHLYVVRLALDHLCAGGSQVEKAILLLNGGARLSA